MEKLFGLLLVALGIAMPVALVFALVVDLVAQRRFRRDVALVMGVLRDRLPFARTLNRPYAKEEDPRCP